MTRIGHSSFLTTFAFAAALGIATLAADAEGADAGSAAALRERHAGLKAPLRDGPFRRPLHMASTEGTDGVSGEIHAVVGHPFATVGAALGQAPQWCEILILHLNTKYCRASGEAGATRLHVVIGKKFDQPVEDAYSVDFNYEVAASSADYLRVKLGAAEGPIGTRDYRIVLEAAPVEGGRTFIRLAYSYSFGSVGRMAMQAYLGTIGRNKVGFTLVGEPGAEPHPIAGMRGLVERNTMRYYLAIEAYLGALSAAPPARMEKSLRAWFAAIEGYPRQLHEMEQGEYLEMKRREYARQQAGPISRATRPPA